MAQKSTGDSGRKHCSIGKPEWYVPFHDGHAIIHHGHEDPDNHTRCGPKVFCCPKAAHLLTRYHPNVIPTKTAWQFMRGKGLAAWMGSNGPQIYFFFFCDPEESQVLRFVGVKAPDVEGILLKKQPLYPYLEVAGRIAGPMNAK